MAFNKGLTQIDKERINQGIKDLISQGKSEEEIMGWKEAQVSAAKANVPQGQTGAPAGQPSTDLASGDGISDSQEESDFQPATWEEYAAKAGKKKDRVDEDGELINLAQDFGEAGALVESIPFIGDFIDDMYGAVKQGYAQGQTVDDSLALFTAGGDANEEQIQGYLDAAAKLQNYPPSKEMQDFDAAFEEAGGGTWGFISAIAQNPSIGPATMISSMVAMLNPASAAGAGAGAAAGAGLGATAAAATFGISAGVGAVSGAFAGAGAILETGTSFSEFLQEELTEKGLSMNIDDVSKVLQDPEALMRIRGKSAARGGIIGIIDGVTGGIAGKAAKGVASTAKHASRLKGVLAATAIEGAGGGVGEATARLAVGQELDAKEIGLEIIGEFGTGVAIGKAAIAGQPKYSIGGQSVNRAQIESMIDSGDKDGLASIEVKNDSELSSLLKERVTEVDNVNFDSDIITSEENEARNGHIDTITQIKKERMNHKKGTPTYKAFTKGINLEKQKLSGLVSEQKKGYAGLSEDQKNIIRSSKEDLGNFDSAIEEIQGKYKEGETVSQADQAIIANFNEQKQEITEQVDQVRAQGLQIAADRKDKAEAKKQEQAVEEQAEEAGVDVAKFEQQKEQIEERVKEDVESNGKTIDSLKEEVLDLGVDITPVEGTVDSSKTSEYAPLSKDGDTFSNGDFEKKIESYEDRPLAEVKKAKLALEQKAKQMGAVSNLEITQTPDGLARLDGTLSSPKREQNLTEEFPIEAEASPETEQVIDPESGVVFEQGQAAEEAATVEEPTQDERTPQDYIQDTLSEGRVEEQDLGEGPVQVIRGASEREAYRAIGGLKKRGHADAKFEKIGDDYVITPGERAEGEQIEYSAPESAPKDETPNAPVSFKQHQNLREVAGKPIQLNIGLENNPVDNIEGIIKKLQSDKRVRLGSTEQVNGEYNGEQERTVVVNAKFDGTARDFRAYIESLSSDLTQEAIGAKYNGNGALIYDPKFKGDRYSFDPQFFENPSNQGKQVGGRKGALNDNDVKALGIDPGDIINKAKEGQSYVKEEFGRAGAVVDADKSIGGKGGMASGGDAREAITTAGKAMSIADGMQLLETQFAQGPNGPVGIELKRFFGELSQDGTPVGTEIPAFSKIKYKIGEPLTEARMDELRAEYDALAGYIGASNNLDRQFGIKTVNTLNLDTTQKPKRELGPDEGTQVRPEQEIGVVTPTDHRGRYGRPRSVIDRIQADKKLEKNIQLGKDSKPQESGTQSFDPAFDRSEVKGPSTRSLRSDLGKQDRVSQDLLDSYNKGKISDNKLIESLTGLVIGGVPSKQGKPDLQLQGFALERLVDQVNKGNFKNIPLKNVFTKARAIARSAKSVQSEAYGESRSANAIRNKAFAGENSFYTENGYEPGLDELTDHVNDKTAEKAILKSKAEALPEFKALRAYDDQGSSDNKTAAKKALNEAKLSVKASQQEIDSYLNDNPEVKVTSEQIELARNEDTGQLDPGEDRYISNAGVQGASRDSGQDSAVRAAGLDDVSSLVLSPQSLESVDSLVEQSTQDRLVTPSEGKFQDQAPRRGAGFNVKGDKAAADVKKSSTRATKDLVKQVEKLITGKSIKDSYDSLKELYPQLGNKEFSDLSKNEKEALRTKIAKGIVQETEQRLGKTSTPLAEFSSSERSQRELDNATTVVDTHGLSEGDSVAAVKAAIDKMDSLNDYTVLIDGKASRNTAAINEAIKASGKKVRQARQGTKTNLGRRVIYNPGAFANMSTKEYDALASIDKPLLKQMADKLAKAWPNSKIYTDGKSWNEGVQMYSHLGVKPDMKGFVIKGTGEVFINPQAATKDTLIHEFGHLHAGEMQINNPKMWLKGVELLTGRTFDPKTKTWSIPNPKKVSKYAKAVYNNPAYKGYPPARMYEEIMANAIGKKGAEIFENATLAGKWDAFMEKASHWLKKQLGIAPSQNFESMTLDQWLEGAVAGTFQGEGATKPSAAQVEYSAQEDPSADPDVAAAYLAGKAAEGKWYKSPLKWLIPPAADDYHGLVSRLKGIPGIQKVTDAFVKDHQNHIEKVTQARAQVKEIASKLGIPLDKKNVVTYKGNKLNAAQAIQAHVNGFPNDFSNQPEVLEYIEAMQELGVLKVTDNYALASPAGDLYKFLNNDMYVENFKDFNAVKGQVFNDAIMNKIAAEHGEKYSKALGKALQRMSSGKNSSSATDATTQKWNDWALGSVGTIMFLNFRSAALQLMSVGNFGFAAKSPGKFVANFFNPETFKEAKKLFNSGYLKERRARAGFDVNAQEMLDILAKSDSFGAFTKKILNFGFSATSFVDSVAIAMGGAAFIKAQTDSGVTEKEAMRQWKEQTEEAQQSARPDRVSQWQTEGISKFVLAFANTPQQYFRLSQKAFKAIREGKDVKRNLAKIGYYMAIQNALFTAAQAASLALLGGGDDDEEVRGQLSSMAGTILRGMGLYGAVIDAGKNVIVEAIKQNGKANPDHVASLMKATSISPPLNRKIQDLQAIGRGYNYDSDDKHVTAVTKGIAVTTNLPADWAQKKYNAAKNLSDDQFSSFQKLLMLAGWSEWNFKDKKDNNFDFNTDDLDFDFDEDDLDFDF